MTLRISVPLVPAWFRWIGVVGIAGFIFYASIITVPPAPPIDVWKPELLPLDKWLHFVAYAGLGGALTYAITDWSLTNRYQALLVFATIVLYGFGIEVIQAYLPYRSLSYGDAYANALGAVIIMPWFLFRPYLAFLPVTDWLARVPTDIIDTG